MEYPVIILGAGGHARVLIDTLQLLSYEIVGLIAPSTTPFDNVYGHPVIGDDDHVWKYSSSSVLLVNGLGSVKSTESRENIYKKFKEAGYSFANVIHPSAIISKDVQLLEGAQVMAGAVIQTGSIIGANSIVNTRASIDHECIIGENTHIAPGVTLSGGVTVGDGVHLGTGAIVIQGISIGDKSLIAAGAVVTKSVREHSVVAGIPAREV